MAFKGWSLRRRGALLLGILMLDGALLGSMGGIAGAYTADGNYITGSRTTKNHAAPEEWEQNIWKADNSKDILTEHPGEKVIALTFDDGPHDVCTSRLLDGLKERGVHATFFLMGENIEGNEALVRRMQEEGHLIGNHSYRHIQLTKAGEDKVCDAIEQTEEIISGITGTRPQYLRPPYGDWNDELECRMNLTTVFWTVDSLDWQLQNTSKIVQRVLKRAGNSDIILMHDIFPTSVDAALQIVDTLQGQGYTFVTVDELMID